ncbi:Homeobox protein CDX-2 [Saguinus oedipus]|uniref:Homeobox protein CDX-2 n=1 Tax=Saguinus oedipus TaxID=9490 RepID=A0ABQ9VTW6_SAGOE|nr:Homeobox protein CDX-2 [Saguinus oedipus]
MEDQKRKSAKCQTWFGQVYSLPSGRGILPISTASLCQSPAQNSTGWAWCVWGMIAVTCQLLYPAFHLYVVKEMKTRTKDKYRVVYTDHQRLELEKEFHYSRYITIRRKAELAATLGLSERQVKIWFQNRRAKERKINKKKLQQQQQQQPQPQPPPPPPPQPQPGPLRSVPESLSPVSSLQGSVPGSVPGVLGPTGGVLNPTVTQ